MSTKERRINKKAVKISLIVIASLLAALLLLLCGFVVYARAPLGDYYKNAEKAFVLPGLKEGFIPQGLAYDDKNDVFYVSGYNGNAGRPSSVFAVTKSDVKEIFFRDEDGEKFEGHSGGVTLHGDYMYLAGSGKGCLYVIRYSDVLAAKNGDFVDFCGKFDTFLDKHDPIRVSFTGDSGTHIYVGEYYRKHTFPTPDTHRFEYGDEEYGGVVLEYAYDESAPFGIAPTPTKAVSVVDSVQGMCFDDKGRLYLSTSCAFEHSYIYAYDFDALPSLPDLTVGEATIPHRVTAPEAKKLTVITPPMSEEILILDGKLYAACEFASSRFFLGNFTGAKYCYALDLSKYE